MPRTSLSLLLLCALAARLEERGGGGARRRSEAGIYGERNGMGEVAKKKSKTEGGREAKNAAGVEIMGRANSQIIRTRI